MIDPPTNPGFSDSIERLEAGALDFFAAHEFNTLGNDVLGQLCPTSQVTVGDGQDYPLATSNRSGWRQYLFDVKSIRWEASISGKTGSGVEFSDSGAGVMDLRVGQEGEGGEDDLRLGATPNLAERRSWLINAEGSPYSAQFGLLAKDESPDAGVYMSIFGKYFDISDFVGDQNPSNKRVAHDSSTSMYYPYFLLDIRNLNALPFSTRSQGFHPVGTASIEGMGSCPLYANLLDSGYTDVSASFTATIETRFSDVISP